MIDLAIDPITHLIYEGIGGYGRGISPPPLVMRAIVRSTVESVLIGSDVTDLYERGLIFREDASDPVTRIRRGRFYFTGENRPVRWIVSPHPAAPDDTRRAVLDGRFKLDVVAFQSYLISEEIKLVVEGHHLILLGNRTHFTPWSVINIEMSIANQEIVTLRSRATFGALPRLLSEMIPEKGKDQVHDLIEKLAGDIYRAGPQSVIDRARDTAAGILSTYMRSNGISIRVGADLNEVIDGMNAARQELKKEIMMHASHIVRLFHSRGKPNIQERWPILRGVHERDAELAVLCIGTILCDLGWASWD